MIAMYFISPPSRVLPGGALGTIQSGPPTARLGGSNW
jgi:hypothetical protein